LKPAGADARARDKNGDTALHAAIHGPDVAAGLPLSTVLYLCETGKLDMNVRNNYGRTALHSAVLRGKSEVIKELLASGIEPTIRDNDGKTALDLARGEAAMHAQMNKEFGASADRDRILGHLAECTAVFEHLTSDPGG